MEPERNYLSELTVSNLINKAVENRAPDSADAIDGFVENLKRFGADEDIIAAGPRPN